MTVLATSTWLMGKFFQNLEKKKAAKAEEAKS
jgi:hypothetical protein